MKLFIKRNYKLLIGLVLGLVLSTTGVIAATILSGSEVSYTGNKVENASNIQQAIDNLYTKASTSSSECRTGYQKQSEDGPNYQCSRIARQCSGDNCTVCIRAERMHTETCNNTSTYCAEDGYSAGATITYGNITTTTGVLNTGDAFDCDVNGDGTYDSTDERFYYVSTKNNGITTDSNTAVLIYYNNTVGGVSSTTGSKWYSLADNSYGPETARDNLPTASQWSNVQLSQTVRDLTYENNTVRVTDFSYEGYAARLLTYQEVNAGCYDGTTSITSTGGVSSKCKFLMENSKYSNDSNPTYGPWLESPHSGGPNDAWYVLANIRRVSHSYASDTSRGARPAIEVLKSDISY